MEQLKILFFTHDLCAPCIPVSDYLKTINISMFGKKLLIEKIDINKCRGLTAEYKVTSVPTLIIGNERLTTNITQEDIIDSILKAYIESVKI